MGVEQPARRLLTVGEEPEKGTPVVAEAHERCCGASTARRSSSPATSRAGPTAGEADVVVTDGFTGNVAIKLMEGTTRTLVGAIRDAIRSGTLSKVGGLLIRGRLGELRERSTPRRSRAPTCSGCAGSVVVCHGASTRRAIANAIALADRGVRRRSSERTGAALEAAGVGRGARAPSTAPGSSVAFGRALMAPNREEVLERIRAHLSEELGIDASIIEEGSRFKEDLEADSLDLVELVVELEDRYGIRMAEDEAERDQDRRGGGRLRARRHQSTQGLHPDTDALDTSRTERSAGPIRSPSPSRSRDRRSRTRRGSEAASSPTSGWPSSGTAC